MEPIIYIKAPQCIDITDPSVTFGDFLTIYCTDTKIQNKLNNLHSIHFLPESLRRLLSPF